MWTRIRTFGELQILTRASYSMLVLVPILVALWPAIRAGINRYNSAVTEANSALEAASERLEFAASAQSSTTVQESVKDTLNHLNERLDEIIADHSLKTIENTRLPSVWAYSFLAALAVTIGHLIYQARAPAIVKQRTIREFANSEVRDYLELPTSGRIERAEYCDSIEQKRFSLKNKSGLFGWGSCLGQFINQISITKRKTTGSISDEVPDVEPEDERLKALTLIERGAEAQYREAAKSNMLAAIASALCYTAGLALIAWIILTQTCNVIDATWG